MAVYTKISKDELNDFLKNYEIGKITILNVQDLLLTGMEIIFLRF